jgi:hypothetical protein
LPQEALLNTARERIAVEHPEPARQLSRRHSARQFEQREWVAARLGDDPLDDLRVEPTADRRLQQPARIVVGDPLHDQLRQPAQIHVGARLAHREQQADGLGQQTPRRERQGQCGSTVKPLRVIDHADQRLPLRDLSQQTQNRQRNEEADGRRARALPKHGTQRLALGTGQPLAPVKERHAQLMKTGERQLHLGFHARRPRGTASRRALQQILKQRGLAHPGLATQHQDL